MKGKKLLLGILAGMMMMSGTVWAEGENTVKSGAQNDSYINKLVYAAEGVTPTTTYTIKFQQIDDSHGTTSATSDVVTLGDQTITVLQDNTNKNLWSGKAAFSTILSGKTFPHAGTYVYEVTEDVPEDADGGVKSSEVEPSASGEKITETIQYDTSKFELKIYVKNSNDGTAVDKITVDQPNDKGKVDPTDQDPTKDGADSDQKPATVDARDGFTFVNSVTRSVEKTPNDGTDGVLNLSKKVVDYENGYKDTNNYGDSSKEFTFSITVNNPATTVGTSAIKGYKFSKGDETTLTKGGVITFTAGTAKTITLKDGEAFSFETLPLGATYTIEEAGTANYIAKYAINKVEGAQRSGEGTMSQALTAQAEASKGFLFTAEDIGAKVEFTNGFDNSKVTPTGIVINNLPYIILVALAILGFAVMSIRKRNRI